MYKSGKELWAPELLKRRPDVTMEQIDILLHGSAELTSGAE
jgi:hypothetical protein